MDSVASQNPIQIFQGITQKRVFETTQDFTLYVRTTGSDSNGGLTTDTALLTIQEAIDRIPKFIKHTVVIDIGSGTFGGFCLASRIYTAETASLTIRGVVDLATGLASGTNSGTATGGSTSTLVDAGQSWTANDLRGRMALVNGEYRVIYSNDATSITFVGVFTATCSGKAYQIVEPKTILNTICAYSAVVTVTGQTNFSISPNWYLQNLRINTPSGASYYGMRHEGTGSGSMERVCIYSQASQTGWRMHTVLGSVSGSDIYITGGDTGMYGIQAGNMPTATPMLRIFCYNITTYGFRFFYTTQVAINYAVAQSCGYGFYAIYCSNVTIQSPYIVSCTTAGIALRLCPNFAISGTGTTVDSCTIGMLLQGVNRANLSSPTLIQNSTSHGVQLGDTTFSYRAASWLYVDSTKILNNGGSGIFATGSNFVRINSLGTAGGTGNTRFGVELEDGAQAFVRSGIITNPLTGAMGDATIDDSKAVLTWATQFAVDLNIVYDPGANTFIKRRD
jgi:hypothetical protein